MAEGKTPPSLDELDRRLAEARERRERQARGPAGLAAERKGYGLAVRLAIELASTLAVGVLLGWALDNWLGTRPWLLVVGFFLGAAAGALNVYRVTQAMAREADKGEGTAE